MAEQIGLGTGLPLQFLRVRSVEHAMGHLHDGERAKILGLNAARIFGFDIPERYLHHPDAAAVAAQH